MPPMRASQNGGRVARQQGFSAGQRGTQILLAPQDYLRVAKATVADLTKEQARP